MIDMLDKALRAYISSNEYSRPLLAAMSYSLFGGGKRLRPLLLLNACRDLGGELQNALPFACALEMIHTYSLIHDDLPAMDNDDMRRGRPTCHIKYGEAVAILAGDALLNMAYEAMSEACCEADHVVRAAAMRIIARAAGASGMVGGQAADVINENKIANALTLQYIHRNKTAALFSAALHSGAVIAGAGTQICDHMANAGINLGLAFQIKDDISDMDQESEIGKNSYVSMFGLDKAREDFAKYSIEAVRLIEAAGISGGGLRSMADELGTGI